jgi:polysaccharide chain length determinant protein (PEP-CTERM system associated)
VRLAEAQRNLSELRLAYTEKHPDVIAARKKVKELQALSDAAKKGGTTEGQSQISNPAYEQLRLKLVDAQTAIATLKEKRDKLDEDYKRVKALSATLPEVAAKSQDIDRDYGIIKTNYDELVKRRESASLSQAADDRADRTQFRIVDPPLVPLAPAFPNRTVLMSLVFLIGLVGGAMAPIGLAQIRPTFSTATKLRELGLPVIGTITRARSAQQLGFLGETTARAFVAGFACLFVLYGAIVVFVSGLYKGIL